ncbi:hypothetical protein [Kitasatospora aureofaciens]|uniref:hypothetical protein n=1 Tax=Kitasatospora aureofaciens TaxID=1894 RepID=UPI0037F3D8F4|nr:hypothetical protein [Kitasatospora aureofaciens]
MSYVFTPAAWDSPLVELGRCTGFLDCFMHAGSRQARSLELRRILPAVLIASAALLVGDLCLAWAGQRLCRMSRPAGERE